MSGVRKGSKGVLNWFDAMDGAEKFVDRNNG
jgi:hypothetical protein